MESTKRYISLRLPFARMRVTGLAILIFILCSASIVSYADRVTLNAPSFLKSPIRDRQPLMPDSIAFSRNAEEIQIPDIGAIDRFENFGFSNLKKVSFGNIDYVPGGLFQDNETIEEIEFNGIVGHFDCVMAVNCPKLRKIVFHGPVSSTGGPAFAHNCPKLESVVFEGPVTEFGLGLSPGSLCPKLDRYVVNSTFLSVFNDSLTPKATMEQLQAHPSIVAGLERTARWQEEVLRAKDSEVMRKIAYEDAKVLLPVLRQLKSDKADGLQNAMEYAWNLGDDVKSELEILKESPEYCFDTIRKPAFSYANPSDSLLCMTRERFNLDSIAGSGDDISRIKNLLYWIHDNITHDGGNRLAPGPRNLRNTFDSAKRDSCGYNCRALAICLAEALLAEGIPARYITCESKAWDSDSDCHVICVAWSESLEKWIWVDPTFAAYVTDENGLLLHPGEVRHRLQHDMPLILNEDANWNNRFKQTKERYLYEYMAKNLYIMSANTLNQAEPEGETAHPIGTVAAIVPLGSNYTNAQIITTDDEWFWQPPSDTK